MVRKDPVYSKYVASEFTAFRRWYGGGANARAGPGGTVHVGRLFQLSSRRFGLGEGGRAGRGLERTRGLLGSTGMEGSLLVRGVHRAAAGVQPDSGHRGSVHSSNGGGRRNPIQ